jgi:integrase/recombinase XerD
MLALAVPAFVGGGRLRRSDPFADSLPGFFRYLASKRGLRPASIGNYQHHLARFDAYLARIGVARLSELSPAILSAFIAERAGAGLAKTSLRNCCGVLRGFLRYAHREGAIASDLSAVMEWPQAYRLSSIPRRSHGRRSDGCWRASIDARRPAGATVRSCCCW